MRQTLLCLPVVLCGCSLLMPRHDPAQAWIDLNDREESRLQAVQVDDQTLEDDRFFQVPPGHHKLQVRLRFEVDATNVGGAQALPRTCLLTLDYPDFDAGQRYQLSAGSRGFRAWAKLHDAQGQVLASGREGRCGEV